MVIEVKKLNPNAKFPEQAYEGDFCYDVVATSCEHAKDSAGNPIENVYKYGIGLAFRVVRGGYAQDIMMLLAIIMTKRVN